MKILHLADVHLGMENYGRIDPSTGLHTRLQDFIKCFRFAIDVALEEKVDLVLFAGDAYKNSFPNPTHQREFARQIYRLSSAQIPVVLVNGNHDNPGIDPVQKQVCARCTAAMMRRQQYRAFQIARGDPHKFLLRGCHDISREEKRS